MNNLLLNITGRTNITLSVSKTRNSVTNHCQTTLETRLLQGIYEDMDGNI